MLLVSLWEVGCWLALLSKRCPNLPLPRAASETKNVMSSSTWSSSWINEGLRILTNYFGEQEDEDSNHNGTTTAIEAQQPHSVSVVKRGAKRKAVVHANVDDTDADAPPPTSTRQRWKEGVLGKVTSRDADDAVHAKLVAKPVVTPVLTELSDRDW